MCKYCEKAHYITKKMTVQKYEENRPKMDGVFGRVEVGRTITQKQPIMRVDFDKVTTGGGTSIYMPLPKEFKFCPNCGKKIGEKL